MFIYFVKSVGLKLIIVFNTMNNHVKILRKHSLDAAKIESLKVKFHGEDE